MGDLGLIPRSGRSSGQGNGNPVLGFLCGSAGKESTCFVGDQGLVPGLGRSSGEGKGYPLQYFGLENTMSCIVHRVAKSRTWLRDFHFQLSFLPGESHGQRSLEGYSLWDHRARHEWALTALTLLLLGPKGSGLQHVNLQGYSSVHGKPHTHYAERKNPDWKSYISCHSNYVTFCKNQSCRDRKQICSSQKLGQRRIHGIWRNFLEWQICSILWLW